MTLRALVERLGATVCHRRGSMMRAVPAGLQTGVASGMSAVGVSRRSMLSLRWVPGRTWGGALFGGGAVGEEVPDLQCDQGQWAGDAAEDAAAARGDRPPGSSRGESAHRHRLHAPRPRRQPGESLPGDRIRSGDQPRRRAARAARPSRGGRGPPNGLPAAPHAGKSCPGGHLKDAPRDSAYGSVRGFCSPVGRGHVVTIRRRHRRRGCSPEWAGPPCTKMSSIRDTAQHLTRARGRATSVAWPGRTPSSSVPVARGSSLCAWR